MDNLSIKEISEKLGSLEGWEMTGHKISKEFRFAGFKEAIEFANRVADESERINHHPDILIRYDRVKLTLTTHVAHGLTNEDFKLARIIEQI